MAASPAEARDTNNPPAITAAAAKRVIRFMKACLLIRRRIDRFMATAWQPWSRKFQAAPPDYDEQPCFRSSALWSDWHDSERDESHAELRVRHRKCTPTGTTFPLVRIVRGRIFGIPGRVRIIQTKCDQSVRPETLAACRSLPREGPAFRMLSRRVDWEYTSRRTIGSRS